MEEYQSFEEKYFGREKPLGKFLREAGKIGGGAVIGLYTIPTRAIKVWNYQLRPQREDYSKNLSKLLGCITGMAVGLSADALLIQNAIDEASHKNYAPAIALGLTNFASLWYEIGRKK